MKLQKSKKDRELEKLMYKKIQLFCIPYAGGMADSFRELAECISGRSDNETENKESSNIKVSNMEVSNGEPAGNKTSAIVTEIIPILLEYAGHGARKTEPFYEDFDEMAEDVARQIREKRDPACGFALLGYSMGSIVTYEILAKDLLGEIPCHIFVAAHEAPDIHWECKTYEQMQDEEFMERMISFGGFPNFDWKLLQNKFFRKLYFLPIREDYRLLSIYRMKKKVMLPAPATMIYSPQDIPEEKIHSWDKFSEDGIMYVELGRNHFFLKEHAEELAEILKTRLENRIG